MKAWRKRKRGEKINRDSFGGQEDYVGDKMHMLKEGRCIMQANKNYCRDGGYESIE